MNRGIATRGGTERSWILIHLFAWLCFLSFPLLFVNQDAAAAWTMLSRGTFWFFALSFMLAFYGNAYLWIPYVMDKRRYVLYGLSIVLLAVLFGYYLKPFDRLMRFSNTLERPVHPPHPPLGEMRREVDYPRSAKPPLQPSIGAPGQRIDVASLYIFLLVIALGSLFQVSQRWMLAQRKVQLAEQERMQAELSFLKAQVHPHFLFNTLNNLYALALTNDTALAGSIYKLSQLMRYYMDERGREKVDIQVEIRAVQDFISLQRLRSGEQCLIVEQYEGMEHVKEIHPFILLPFVENAFKYGLSITENCSLFFGISLTSESCTLVVKNSIPTHKSEQYRSGTGLKNTRRLLEHFYPDHFDLAIQELPSSFEVKLLLYI